LFDTFLDLTSNLISVAGFNTIQYVLWIIWEPPCKRHTPRNLYLSRNRSLACIMWLQEWRT